MSVPQVAIDAVNFYLAQPQPITKDIAVGIVSVLYAGESALNPGSQGSQASETGGVLNPSGAYGIASWNGGRQAKLQAFATSKGLPVGAVNTQLLFVLTEIADGGYPETFAAIWPTGLGNPVGTITYQNFIPIFVQGYEKPANPSAEINRSLAFAQTLYPAITGAPAVVTPAPVIPTPAAPAAPTGATVLDPAITEIIAALAPIFESMISGLISSLLQELLTDVSTAVAKPAAPTPAAPAAPTIDLGALASGVAGLLLPQIGPILSTIVQTEIAKIIPPAAAPKS